MGHCDLKLLCHSAWVWLLYQWGLCELHHCARFPWIWGRADRLGGTLKTDRCVLQRKVWLGKKKEDWVSIVNRVRSGFFFLFWRWWSRTCCAYGWSKRPRQKEREPRISSNWRPTWSAGFVRSSWSQSPQNIRVRGAFFLGRLTLKFSMEFNKKKNQKQKEACGRELILYQALRWPSPRLLDMCSACHRVSLQQVQWLAKSTCKSEKWQAVKKRNPGYLHLNLTM